MSHQPFEDWLFSDEPLDTQQEQTMQNHLDECERCQNLSHALDQVGEIFEFSTTPEPSPGFTQRWFERLNVAQEQRQIKRTWILVLSFFSIASIITITVALMNFNSINWAYQLSQFIANFSLIARKLNQFWRFFQSVADVFPLVIPITIIIGIGLLSLITVLFITWFSSLIKIYKPVEEGVN